MIRVEEIEAKVQYSAAFDAICGAGMAINITLMKKGRVSTQDLSKMKQIRTALFGLGTRYKHVTKMVGTLHSALSHAIDYVEGDKTAREKALSQSQQFNDEIKAFERKWGENNGI